MKVVFVRICELKSKEVINVCTGEKIGVITDVDIELCTGKVESVVIPGPAKICGLFGSDSEYVIPFSCIKKRSGYYYCRDSGRKVFANILVIVYNNIL